MSFFSALGDAWTSSKNSIGNAWTKATENDKQDGTGIGPLDWFGKHVEDPFQNFMDKYVMGPANKALGFGASVVNRGISTGVQTAAGNNVDSSVMGPIDALRENWKNTGSNVVDDQGNRVEGISMGQAFVTAFGGGPGFAMDPKSVAERKKFFHDDPGGQIASGAIDLAGAAFLDPLILVGKAGKASSKASTTLKVEDRAAALGHVEATTKTQARAADRLKSLYERTDGMSAGEIARLPEFQTTSDAGAFAYLFDRANRSYMGDTEKAIEARHALKNDIWGAALGDATSISRLRTRSDDLAQELQRMTERPMPTAATDHFKWEDGGQGMFDMFNAQVAPLTERQVFAVNREIERLNRAVDSAFSPTSALPLTRSELIMAPGREYTKFTSDTEKINESWADLSMAGRPIRVVTRAMGARLPGHINIKNPAEGLTQLTDYLTQVKYLDGETKSGLLDSYVRAATDNGRRAVVDKIEQAVVEGYGTNMGLNVDQARKLLQTVRVRRNAVYNTLSSRLYSAAENDSIVTFHDPEDDITHAFHKPLLQSQIEEHHALTDPRLIEKALGKGTQRRFIDHWLGAKNADRADSAFAAGEDMMTMATRLWKDAALLRLAYPMRVQIDTQGRLITHMGMMQYMAFAKSTYKGQAKWWLTRKDSDLMDAVRKSLVAKNDDTYEQIIAPARNDEEMAKIVRTIQAEPGELANLGNEISSMELRGQRATSSWGRIDPEDPEWYGHWLRAVQQIKASPVARQAIGLDDHSALKAFVNTDPAARREWMNLSEGHESQDEWLAAVQAHVKHYLPTPELKDFALKGSMLELGTMDAVKAAAAGEVRAGATSRLDEVMPTYDEAKAAAETSRQAAQAARKKSQELRAKVGKVKGERTPEAKALRDEWRRSREANRVAMAKAVADEERLAKVQKLAKANEKQARSAQAAQHEIVNPDRTTGMTHNDIRDYFSGEGQYRRMPVHGENFNPIEKSPFREWHERNRKRWYNWASDVPETVMGRSPLYGHSFRQHMKEALARLDGYDGTDNIPADVIDAMRRGADRRARRDVANILFDTSHTSNLAYHFRFLSPFFSAWEDTMKKWGGLFYDKPWALERFNQLWDAPNDAGLVVDSEGNQVDAEGNVYDAKTGQMIDRKTYTGSGEYVVLPAKYVPGLGGDGKLRIRKDSINIIFQGQPWWLPGFGPLVQIPANNIVRDVFPKAADDPIMKYILPFGVTDDSIASQLMPSWVKQVRNTGIFGKTRDYYDTYAMFLAQETARYRNGERKDEPTKGELANRTRNWFILSAAMKNASPVSITPTPRTQYWIERARAFRNEYFADTEAYKNAHGGREWQAEFLKQYPEYFEMSMRLTRNETGIQATDHGYDAIQKYQKAIQDNPEFGWMFAGPENKGEFSSGVYNWMKATSIGPGGKDTFLTRLSPEEALKKVQAEKGWIEYNRINELVQVELDRRGIKSTRDAPDLAFAKGEAIKAIGKDNLSWYDEFNKRDGATVERLLSAAQDGWKKYPSLADRQDQVALQDYIKVRNLVRLQLKDREFHTLDAKANEDLSHVWDEYVASLRERSIGFSEIYDRILEADDLNKELMVDVALSN